MKRRHVIAGAGLALLAVAAAWLALGRPPPGWVVRHGLPPAGGPTGRAVEIEGVRFLEIGPGFFRMGSEHGWDRGDLLGRLSALAGLSWGRPAEPPTDEMPVRWVEIRTAYWLAETEVTNAQYERFDPAYERDWPGDDDPVTGVMWDEAQAYCDWLSTRGSLRVRLPSEAEWEFACRAGSRTEFCYGDEEESLPEYAWFGANSDGRAHALKTRRPNGWGLFDLHGNVWEFCGDACGPYADAPRDGTARAASVATPYRVTRGGGWNGRAVRCRSAGRGGRHPDNRDGGLGFRPAASGH